MSKKVDRRQEPVRTQARQAEPVPASAGSRWWIFVVALVAVVAIAIEAYSPALNGQFLFDDEYLPFTSPEVQNAPLQTWLGVRPLLMFSYWLNYTSGGLEPYGYHLVNLLLHIANALLIWWIARKFLQLAGEVGSTRELLAGFAAGLFLLHPVQTESVSYVASRSETMSVFFFLAAFGVFLYRPEPAISWVRSVVVLLLFGAAASSKEHTVVLPAILLLTDFFFTTPFRFEGIRRNYRLYVPMLAGAAIGAVAVWRVLSSSLSAGFGLRDFTWYEYLFTQFGVIWVYVRLFFFPVGQNADYDWGVSRSLANPGSIVGLIAIAAGLVLAWRYRRRYPLAAFGFIAFLILLAPTSSVVPIRDIIAERRLYLPFLSLTLIVLEFLRRWRPSPAMVAAALALVLAVAAFATYQRNHVWSNSIAFWQDVTEKSPKNARAWFQLAYGQWQNGNCFDSVRTYEKVGQLQKPDERLLIDWALALDCAGQPDQAIAKLRQAAALPPPSALVYAQIGMIYGKNGRAEEALAALDEAQRVNPNFDMIYFYRGNVFLGRGDFGAAAAQYRQALTLNPNNAQARQSLTVAEQRIARPR